MKKIVTFISKYNASSTEKKYTSADGSITVSGEQTNEAPIRYLLQLDPDIQEIICIVTEQVAAVEAGLGCSAYDNFKKKIQIDSPDVTFRKVMFQDSTEKFTVDALPEILQLITPEDCIYLETTGGFRDAVTYLMQISRVLLYQGTNLEKAVYSKYPACIIEDVTDTYRMFDLINGLNEFQHYCNMDSLITYFKKDGQIPAKWSFLIRSMQQLSECIIMCQTENIEGKLEKFRSALHRAKQQDDPLLQTLLPIFEEKFAELDSIPHIIRWCLDNNLIQQALTIYNERMPEYLIRTAGFLTIPEKFSAAGKYSDYYRIALNDLDNGFFSIGKNITRSKKEFNQYREDYMKSCHENFQDDFGIRTIDHMLQALKHPNNPGFDVNIDISVMQRICLDYMYISLMRNHLNHAGGELVMQRTRSWYLHDYKHYLGLNNITLQTIKNTVSKALNLIEEQFVNL